MQYTFPVQTLLNVVYYFQSKLCKEMQYTFSVQTLYRNAEHYFLDYFFCEEEGVGKKQWGWV